MDRGLLAIVAGFLLVVALWVGADAVMQGLGVFPAETRAMGSGLFLLATAYRAGFTLAGGWLAARLSPRDDQRDVQALAGLGFLA